jgi:hypothetical protein
MFPFNCFSFEFLYFSKTYNFSINLSNLSSLLLKACIIYFNSSSVNIDKIFAFSSSVNNLALLTGLLFFFLFDIFVSAVLFFVKYILLLLFLGFLFWIFMLLFCAVLK